MTTTVLRLEAVLGSEVVDVRDALLQLVALQPPPSITEDEGVSSFLEQIRNVYSEQLYGFGCCDLENVASMDSLHGYVCKVTLDEQNYAQGDTLSIGPLIFTLENAVVTPFDVLIGSNETETADNLVATINANSESSQFMSAIRVSPSRVHIHLRGLSMVSNLVVTESSNPTGITLSYGRFVIYEVGAVDSTVGPAITMASTPPSVFSSLWGSLVGQNVDCWSPDRLQKRNTGTLTVTAQNVSTLTVNLLASDPADLALIQPSDEFIPVTSSRSLNTFHRYGGR